MTDKLILAEAAEAAAITLSDLPPGKNSEKYLRAGSSRLYLYAAVAEGFNLVLPFDCLQVVLVPNRALVAGTIVLPANPKVGHNVQIISTGVISQLTVLPSAPQTMAAYRQGTVARQRDNFLYETISNSWV